jgi:hypothetical protein
LSRCGNEESRTFDEPRFSNLETRIPTRRKRTYEINLQNPLRSFLVEAMGNIPNIYRSGTLDPRLVPADFRCL